MKKYVFFYHYNKAASRAAGHNILTIHYRGTCHLVEKVVCKVQTETKNRARQPHCVLWGKGILEIKNNVGYIS